jgi:acetyltransferase-like isoleucine patch superfamily enzyme
MSSENPIIGIKNRLLQLVAMHAPGARKTRVWCHRKRGVKIGQDVWIGTGALIETSSPWLVTIGSRVIIGIRATIIAHFHSVEGVTIEDDVFIGPGVIVLPGTTIGKGSVVTAGSVVTKSVPCQTLVQGNPAVPVARCGIPLGLETSGREFSRHLKPFKRTV